MDRHDDDDEERHVRNMQDWERRRADRSDEQWWKEDHLSSASGGPLAKALDTLAEGCRCDVGRLLSDLREIESLSVGYDFFSRRELPTLIRQMRRLSQTLWAVEQSPVGHMVPPQTAIPSEQLRKYADALDHAREATSRIPRPERAKRIVQLIAFVDDRVREYGEIGKSDADASLAVLLGGMTRERWTGAALRTARSRTNKKRGRKRVRRDPRRVVRPVRGSRARPRQRRLVPLDLYRAEKEGEPPDEPPDAGQPADDPEDRDDEGQDD
jgi:hypothetical protein